MTSPPGPDAAIEGVVRPTVTDAVTLLAVAALWGGSFLFMRVAVHDLGPVALIEARVLLAGLALFAVVALLGRAPAWRRDWRGYLVLGGVSAAAPFTLIAFAELHITASLAAILNATVPLFALLLGAARGHEPLTGRRLAGVLLGVLGVGVLVGLGPLRVDGGVVLATAASLLAAFLLAFGGVYAKARFAGTPPITIATGQQLGAAALLLVPALALPPARTPTPGVAGAVLALALACTAVGFALFYRLLARLGATGALSVTFLVPVFGVTWGAAFLGEDLTPGMLVGLAIVLTGIALVTGLGRQRPPTPQAGERRAGPHPAQRPVPWRTSGDVRPDR